MVQSRLFDKSTMKWSSSAAVHWVHEGCVLDYYVWVILAFPLTLSFFLYYIYCIVILSSKNKNKTRRRSRLWITQSSMSWLDAQSLLHVGPPYPFNSITLICSGFVYNLFLHCCEAVGKFVLTHRVAWSVWVSRASCYFSGPDDALGQVCVCIDSYFWVKWLSIYIYGMVLQLDSI